MTTFLALALGGSALLRTRGLILWAGITGGGTGALAARTSTVAIETSTGAAGITVASIAVAMGDECPDCFPPAIQQLGFA